MLKNTLIFLLPGQQLSPQHSQDFLVSVSDEPLTVKAVQDTNRIERFFTSEREGSVQFRPEPITKVSEDWQIIALLLSVLAIAFVRITGRNFFKNLQSGFVSRPIFKQLFRDGQLLPTRARVPLFISFLLAITVFLFQLNTAHPFISFPKASNLYANIATIFLIVGMYELLKFILTGALGYTFKTKLITKEYTANNIFYNSLTAILIVPLLLFSIYSTTPVILFFASGIVLILFFIKIFRGFLIAVELRTYSFYQIILYICTLEILPVYVLIKTLTYDISMI